MSNAATTIVTGQTVKPHSGFFKVSEAALRRIEASFDKPSDTRAAILAHVTFCRIANLRGKTTFEARIADLARDMSLPYREAHNAIKLVESIGLLSVIRRKIPATKANLPSIYSVETLLPNATTLKQGATTFGEDGVRRRSPRISQELPQEIHTSIHGEEAK
jgi:hypothetical protein